MEPILSVIIVEYHSIQEIEDCVASLKAHINLAYEIIVSSNSCYDAQEREQINQHEANVIWLFNDSNAGFARAMNAGLRKARGKYLVIMNSDCMVKSELSPMVAFMDKHPEVGAIAPKMVDKEGNIQDTARPYVTLP